MRNTVVLIVCYSIVALAAESVSAAPVQLRELWGKELLAARQLRDQADRMRHEFERRYRTKGGVASPNAPEAQAEFDNVVHAYRRAIETYPDTGIAAYCLIRLSGAHQYRRDYASGAQALEEVAARFAGTEYEAKAYFELGVMELQGRKDPEAAAAWLKKVPAPAGPRNDGAGPGRLYGSEDYLWVAAQQQIAKAEVRGDKPALAEARYQRLGEHYPAWEEGLRQEHRRETNHMAAEQFGISQEAIFDNVLENLDHWIDAPGGEMHKPQVASPDSTAVVTPPATQIPPASGSNAFRGWKFYLGLGMIGVGVIFIAASFLLRRHSPSKGDSNEIE